MKVVGIYEYAKWMFSGEHNTNLLATFTEKQVTAAKGKGCSQRARLSVWVGLG